MTEKATIKPPVAVPDAKSVTDAFIAAQLPGWLRHASVPQIDTFSACLKAHQVSGKRVAEATRGLLSPQQFASQVFQPILDTLDLGAHAPDTLQWLEIRYGAPPSVSIPEPVRHELRFPAVLRLMQGFAASSSFFEGTGVVLPGSTRVLSGAPGAFAERCRALDAGQQYQELLDRQFPDATLALLADHHRTGFAVACQRALMQAHLGADEHAALMALSGRRADDSPPTLRAEAGQLTLLGCTIANALLIRLRNASGDDAGVVLYLPLDHGQPIRCFETLGRMTSHLSVALLDRPFLQSWYDAVRLHDRPTFRTTLSKRLLDDHPDLKPDSTSVGANVFDALARAQVARFKEDGRALLVPSADADRQAAEERLRLWEGVGLTVLGLAGLAVPTIGVVLFAEMLVDTLGEVYAGVVDWHEGHQHEALGHMLEVARTVAAAAGTVAVGTLVARAFTGSTFVDALEPVTLEDDKQRLWSADLQAYEVMPEQPLRQDNGLFKAGGRYYLRIDRRYYEAAQEAPGKAWRLRHPGDEQAFGPRLEHNGERFWRVCLERPVEWDDTCAMLDRLWPHQPALDAERAEQILTVAGLDQDELRGILVENRPAPVNLRDTLRRFEADARIATLFEQLQAADATLTDTEVLRWCQTRSGVPNQDARAAALWLQERRGQLQGELLEHLARITPPDNPLFVLVKRDFPGLPDAYVEEVVRGAEPELLAMARLESRVPYSIATRARSLLELARLNRGLEGLYLQSAYSDTTGELVLAQLGRLQHWPSRLNLELRQGSEFGRRLAIIDPQGAPDAQVVLVRRDGQFRLYDTQGHEREEEVLTPQGIFEAVVALLDDASRAAMALDPGDSARSLRQALVARLPGQRSELLKRLGWRSSRTPWFNPGQRLPDGRVGYRLGGGASRGRASDATGVLRQRVRALYPTLTDTQIEAKVQELQHDPDGRSPFQALLHEENELVRLERTVMSWVEATAAGPLRMARREFAHRLCNAWRYHCEEFFDVHGQTSGRGLDVSNCAVEVLPVLPGGVDFGHITRLVMCRMGLRNLPASFLASFDNVRVLNLNGNQLVEIPPGLVELEHLDELRLAGNRIEMDDTDEGRLARLWQVTTLDLSRNPIRTMRLRFDQIPQLQRLYMSRCRLQSTPVGLHHCGLLSLADFSSNQISSVPEEVLAMPVEFRYRLRLEHNALPAQLRRDLYRLGPHRHPAVASSEVQGVQARWVALTPEAEHESNRALWTRLAAKQGGGELFKLLAELTKTSDFTAASDYLAGQLWELLRALDEDAALRELVFADSSEADDCVDRVADRFSRLLVQRLVHQANLHAAKGQQGDALLQLARQLFRLEQLEQLALADAVGRREAAPVDVLEVVIGYRIALAPALDLPCQPKTMRFTSLAGITDARRDAALLAVTASEASDALADSIAGRDFWRTYLEKRHAGLFAAVLTDLEPEQDALEASQATLTSDAYLRQWDLLKSRREQREHDLFLQLTRQALGRTKAGETLVSGESAQTD
ncbi:MULTISPECIES: NEL-type E3 ubiquitin ligase domain-containing protein [unclassified Pseudomonas]|uniref:NEL-type E3 ubiquitin ligase domain-containing protein n=1 Tax=unclassified Pseudomonas TaxID=196821 RepID=UPI0035C084E9